MEGLSIYDFAIHGLNVNLFNRNSLLLKGKQCYISIYVRKSVPDFVGPLEDKVFDGNNLYS